MKLKLTVAADPRFNRPEHSAYHRLRFIVVEGTQLVVDWMPPEACETCGHGEMMHREGIRCCYHSDRCDCKKFIPTHSIADLHNAEISLDDNHGAIVCEMTDYENQASLARLFAGAPDLLEACESVLNGNLDCGSYWKVDSDDIRKIASAISKAKGVSE